MAMLLQLAIIILIIVINLIMLITLYLWFPWIGTRALIRLGIKIQVLLIALHLISATYVSIHSWLKISHRVENFSYYFLFLSSTALLFIRKCSWNSFHHQKFTQCLTSCLFFNSILNFVLYRITSREILLQDKFIKASTEGLSIIIFTTICFYWRSHFYKSLTSTSWPSISKNHRRSRFLYWSTS